ncbi:MAG: diguanylate cyclase [Campylobacterota bacterium]|nr:diguanylate cyclase [Campylobacterota bacterium]
MQIKPTILYVEDEDGIRNQLSKFLKHFCSELYLAEDGKIGLELFKQHSPDIIVSDIKMPNMDGIDMAKAIKKINPKQHMIFTTAHAENNYFIEAIETQVDGYILKPINFLKLEEKLIQIEEQINIKKDFLDQQVLTNEITQMLNLLMVLDKDGKAIYSNKNFLNFLHLSNIEEFDSKYDCFSDTFIRHIDYFFPQDKTKSWIEEIQDFDDDKRIVSMVDENAEPKAFLISLKQIEETKHTIIILTEITNMTIEKNKFKYKAYTDELTKSYNRAFFEEEFTKELNKKEDDTKLSVILLDIDNFKSINDTYGHLIGDEILKDLVILIKQKTRQKITRQKDILARWGGEEFIQLLPNASLQNAIKIADNLRKSIEKYIFVNELRITCSFGVAEFSEGDTKQNIIKKADDALYDAKNNGRNKVSAKFE